MLSKLPDVRLTLLGKDLILAKVVKDLGVTFDPNLTFSDRILKIVSSCMPSLARINRVKHMFDRNTLITIINTLVFNKLFSCSSVFLFMVECSSHTAAQAVSCTKLCCPDYQQYKEVRSRVPNLKRLTQAPR